MPIAQMKGLAARAGAELRVLRGRVITSCTAARSRSGDEFLNYTIRKPVGVAGLIMPWNAPLMLSTWRIAPALAAGNTVVLKPAEWSPLTATLLAGVMEEAEIPPGVFNVVQGFGETAGAALSAPPRGRPHLLHRGDHHRADDHRRGRADAEALLDRARRQVSGGRVRGRRSRAVRRRRAGPDLHHERPALHRRARGCSCSRRCTSGSSPRWPARARQHPRRRPDRPAHRARAADPPRAPRAGARTTSPRRARRAPAILAGGERPPGAARRQLPRRRR